MLLMIRLDLLPLLAIFVIDLVNTQALPRSLRAVAVGEVEEVPEGWKFPFINASTRGRRFSYCKLCNSHFSVAHGGVNDVKRHCQGPGHLRKHSESERNAV